MKLSRAGMMAASGILRGMCPFWPFCVAAEHRGPFSFLAMTEHFLPNIQCSGPCKQQVGLKHILIFLNNNMLLFKKVK